MALHVLDAFLHQLVPPWACSLLFKDAYLMLWKFGDRQTWHLHARGFEAAHMALAARMSLNHSCVVQEA